MHKIDIPQAVFDSPSALRIARQATREATEQLNATPRAKLDPGNPNHPDYDLKIFGYDAREFMARQYRT